jgi:hypothetical protein
MRLLLITGGRHPYYETTPIVTRCLRAAGHTVRVTRAAPELTTPAVRRYDAIILNTLRGTTQDGRKKFAVPISERRNDFSAAQRAGLASFVAGGGGLISIHIAPASCPGWPEMLKLTGGGWVWGTSNHPPFGPFEVFATRPAHPIASGLTPFWIEDELYYDLVIPPGVDVFIGAVYAGVVRPLGWTTRYARGRVVNIALGHAGVSAANPSFQKLVLNAVGYLARPAGSVRADTQS